MLMSLFVFSALSHTAYAFDLFPKEVCKAQTKASPVCQDSDSNENPIYGPRGILSSAIIILSIAIGVAAVIVIMYAGLKYITSGSNPQEVTKSRELILYAVVGLIIAGAAQALVRLVLNNL